MTPSEIAKHRLVNQQLLRPGRSSANDMVAWFGAVQAQEYAQTKWSLGLRLPHLKDEDIEKDYTDGKILRTHLLRPTWHFVTHEDIRWMLKLTAPGVNRANAYMYRKLELNSDIFNRCNEILINALKGRKQLTRNELNQAFKQHKIMAEGHRLSYIMMYAELAGIICSGARRGNQFTYALLDERVQTTNSFDRDEALSRLTNIYFSSRGPATIKDFSTWSGLGLTDCKKGLAITKVSFTKEVIENEEYYYPAGTSLHKKSSQDIYLLSVYDEFIMGYKNRSAILEFRKSLHPGPPFRYDCMMVCDGQIIGTWKRTIIKNAINIKYEFFRPMNQRLGKALDKAITALENFTSMPVEYTSRRTTNR